MNQELRIAIARALYMAKPHDHDAWEEEQQSVREYNLRQADVVASTIDEAGYELRKKPERKPRKSKKLVDEMAKYTPAVDEEVTLEEEQEEDGDTDVGSSADDA